jgi:hypothetical protein
MALRIDIKGHISDFKSKLARARGALRNFASGITSTFASIGSTILAAFAFSRLIAGFKSLLSELDKIGKASKSMGLEPEKFQEMAFAAKLAGVEMKQLEKAMGAMASFMFLAASGGKAQERILKALGLTYDSLAKMKPDKQFQQITKAIDGMASATDRMGISKQVFGRAGVDILNMARSYDQAVEQIRSKGGIISKEDIESAEKFNDEWALIVKRVKAAVAETGLLQVAAQTAAEANKKGIVDALGKLLFNFQTFSIFDNMDVSDEIREKFGKPISQAIRESAMKGLEEAKLGKTLKDAFSEAGKALADSVKVDQFRRIGAIARPGDAFGGDKGAREIVRAIRPMISATENIDRKTPEINNGGKF